MKIERKYMAHYLNATFAADDGTASYVRLGKDLEEYSPELSANVEKKTNILGNETVSIDSYQKQGEVSPYYAEKGDPLFEKLQSIIDNDLVLDDLKTDIVEVKLWDAQSSGAFCSVCLRTSYAILRCSAAQAGCCLGESRAARLWKCSMTMTQNLSTFIAASSTTRTPCSMNLICSQMRGKCSLTVWHRSRCAG